MADVSMELPPGFRFHPTDAEIITFYLSPKVVDPNYTTAAIGDADLNKCEPWDLPSIAKMGEKQWYFFCHKNRKYPTGTRANRATLAGYWKATGKDKEIYRGKGVLVGKKKTLVFYKGRAPKGVKTNWVMHEFRIEGSIPKISQEEWVVSRIFHKNNMAEKMELTDGRDSSIGEEHVPDIPMPASMDDSYFNPENIGHHCTEKLLSNNHLFSITSQYGAASYPQILDQKLKVTGAVGGHSKMQQMSNQSMSNQSMMVTASLDTAGQSTDWFTSLVPTSESGFSYNFHLDDSLTCTDPAVDLGNVCNH